MDSIHSYASFDGKNTLVMSLHQQLVLDWLLDYKKLNKSHHGDVHSYCIRIESDSATASALFKLLEDQKSHEDVSMTCVAGSFALIFPIIVLGMYL